MNRSLKEPVCLSSYEFVSNCSLNFSNKMFSLRLIHFEFLLMFVELAKLDKTERRYAWIKRRIRTNEEIWKIFPPAWHVPYRLCILFCKKTRHDLLNSIF